MTLKQLPLPLLHTLPTVLKPRQQQVWDLVRRTPGGITADEAGAIAHANREPSPHSVDERCEWCAVDGRAILNSKALKPLVVKRRRTNKYEPRDVTQRASEPSSQLVELPADLFGGA